jgi:adenosylcobinamide-phosphate synthase
MSYGLLVAGLLLDVLIGDPDGPWHPVRLIGRLIRALERVARRDERRLRWRGIGLALTVIAAAYLSGLGLLYLARQADLDWGLNGWFAFTVSALLLWSSLAVRSMASHAIAVLAALEAGDLVLARMAVAQMVGRETADLDERGVCRALLETVAEGLCDGVVAPLFFAVLGGPPLALAYRAANTLDSMLGYKDEHYRELGWASARLDDVLSWLPARQAALFTTFAAYTMRLRAAAAWRTARVDGPKQPSPNSGWPEGAFAGALGVQLGGPVRYRGRVTEKALLGEALRPLSPGACRQGLTLFLVASITATVLYEAAFWAVHR